MERMSSGAEANAVLTFQPRPATSRPGIRSGCSIKIPQTLRPPSHTSLGHFNPTAASGRKTYTVSATLNPVTSENCGHRC